ncbi:MAG: AraC family transcriptional regulator [Ignavibacteriae bacterium]|nr:AraC family transcriptional regulator [Ignavibacteriota bacterium]
MIIFSLDLILNSLAVTGEIRKTPILIGLMQTFPYLYGPALYLYVCFITHGIKKFSIKYLIHFLPFLLVQIYAIFFFYFEPTSYQLNLVYVENKLPWHVLFISYLTPIYGAYYLVRAIYEVYKFNKKLKENFSSIDKNNLSWINFLITGAVILWITAISLTTIQLIFDNEFKPELGSYLAISIFIYAIAYKSLQQPELKNETLQNEFTKSENSEPYRKSGLKEDEANKYLKQLLTIMDEQKPFKNEKLSLLDLASLVGVSTHNLSEIINTKLEQNFYDFVNSYRVEEVKKLISNDKEGKYNLLAHGFEAGFSSKSAYYSAFKKFTNMTPSQFRSKL